jgi:phosphoketolase
MVVLNNLDRFHLVMDVANRVPKLQAQAAHIKQAHARQAQRSHCVHTRTRRRHAGDSQLELAGSAGL